MALVFSGIRGAGVMDYVTAWYLKASKYIQGKKIKCAFVSTNSITQGEQPGILWNTLFSDYNIKIHFAHRTFNWKNEARGNAAVHVVIIGFGNFDIKSKLLYEYEDINGAPLELKVKNISPYLIPQNDLILLKRTKPLCLVSPMKYGSKPVDGGHYMFTEEEKSEFISKEPQSEKYFREIIGAYEFINNEKKYCLWLTDANPSDLKKYPEVLKRIELVKETRLLSKKQSTQDLALTPTCFAELRQPIDEFIVFPLVSSITRQYIPLGFLNPTVIVNNRCSMIPNATLYEFGVLSSVMHNSWTRCVSGRMKSDFNYSNLVVYNNYPWPKNSSEKKIKAVEQKAQKVIDVRSEFSESSLADLYDPLTMPPKLVKVHQELDRAVDLCYRPQAFANETARIEYLFELYNEYTMPLLNKKNAQK